MELPLAPRLARARRESPSPYRPSEAIVARTDTSIRTSEASRNAVSLTIAVVVTALLALMIT